jgi:hypothetical protein
MINDEEKVRVLLEYKRNIEILSNSWEPHEKQKQILRAIFNDDVKRVFIQAGRKFGKSETCIYAAWRAAMLKPYSQVYIIGPSRKQQGEIMWENGKIERFIKDLDYRSKCEFLGSVYRVKLPNGSFIKIDGSENFESYRGTEYDLMILDEFKDQDPRFYNAAFPNLLAKDGKLIVIGTPPDAESHYTDLMALSIKDPDWVHFHGTSWENDRLPEGGKWLKSEKEKYYARGDGAMWEREYEARFVPGGVNAIFPNFSKKHVVRHETLLGYIERDRRKLLWYTVSDPGTQTCFCVLFIAYNPYTSQVFVLDEIYETDRRYTSTRNIWDRVKEKKEELGMADVDDLYDIAAAWFENEVVDYYGDALISVDKVSKDKDTQISLMKDMMTVPNLLMMSDRCVSTYKEWSNYITDEKGRYKKVNDHSIDGFRYFLTHVNYSFHIDADNSLLEVVTDYREERAKGPVYKDAFSNGLDWEDTWIM